MPAVTIEDGISPALAAKIRAVEDPRPILEAMLLQMLSITQSSFNDPSQRAAPWPAKRDGTAATLRKTQALFKAWRIGAITRKSGTITNSRAYAAIHQLGGRTKAHVIVPRHAKALAFPGGAHPVKKVNHPGSKIPARPMLPFVGSGSAAQLAPFAHSKIQKIGQAKLDALLKQGG